jgi:hypothetical protein
MSQESHFFDDPDAVDDGAMPPVENPVVPVNLDNIKDDGVVIDDYGSPEIPPIPSPEAYPVMPGRGVISKIKFAVVSALGANAKKVESINAFGKTVTHELKSKDVFEIEQRDFAERRLTESKDKWDPKSIEGLNGWQRFGKKIERGLDRIWRGMGAEDAHRAKEKALGAELSGIAGIDSAISEEFHSVIDVEARKRVKEGRKTTWQKIKGGFGDFWAEATATRSQLHVQELIVTQEMRQKYDANPANSDPVENPLYALVNRDVVAREALAARVNESELDILKQTNMGDKKTTEVIKLEGPEGKKVEAFLKKEIMGKAIDDFVTRAEARENVTGISAKLRRELDLKLQDFFMTDDFQDWVKTLPAEQQAMFESSFTYASDMLLQTEEVMLPAVMENLDHYKSGQKLDFEMELCLGTAQLSANTEENKDGWFSKERASLNKELMDKMRKGKNTTANSRIYNSEVIHNSLKNDLIMGHVMSIAKNEALMAWVGAGTGKGVATLARAGMSWLPVLGSAGVAGTLSGIKEWARMDKHRATHGFGKANGLEFPISDRAVKTAELEASDYHRIQLSDRTQQFLEASNKFIEGTADVNTAFMAMAYDADSMARLKLNGERNKNLLVASVDGPEGRGIFARELRIHDKARATSKVMLNRFLADDAKRNEVADLMGIPVGEPRDIDSLMAKLVNSQYNNLLSGVQIDGALSAVISSKDSTLVLAESESMRMRDKLYNSKHWKSSIKYGLTSGAIAGVAAWGLGSFYHHEQTISTTGLENHTVVMVDHALPTHEDILPTAQILDSHGNLLTETHSWLPAGTHLDLVQHRVGGPDDLEYSYNLVTDNTKDQVLLHGITFGSHGEIVNQTSLVTEMAKNHINITPHELAPVSWGTDGTATTTTEINPANWHNSIIWGEQPGMSQGGVDGWVAHNLGAHHTPDGVERVTEINGVRNVWKGLEDDIKNQNMHINPIEGYKRVIHYVQSVNGPQALSAPQSDNLEITNLPDLLGTAGGHVKLAGLIDESVRMHAALQPGQSLDRLHQVVWEASYWGDEAHVPHGADLKLILDWAGETTTSTTPETLHSIIPIENYITIDQDITTVVPVHTADVFTQTVPDWWTSLVAVGYSHPLEAPVVQNESYLAYPNPYPETAYPGDQKQNEKTYQEFQEYLQTYPLNEQKMVEYQEFYSKYPEYNKDSVETNKLLPYYESLYDSIGLTSEEKVKIRVMDPAQRIIELYRITDYELDESRPYVMNLLYLHGLMDKSVNPSVGLSTHGNSTVGKQSLTLTKEKVEEYRQQFYKYPEYDSEAPEVIKILPYYESLYDSMKLAPEIREKIRVMNPTDRIAELYKLANYELDETRPYEANIFYLNEMLTEPKTEKTLMSSVELDALNKQRVDVQNSLIENLKTKYQSDSKDKSVLRTLYRLNGGERGYYEELELLNKDLPPMNEKCEMVSIIPAFNEEGKIGATLEGWLNQYDQKTGERIDPDKFEIIVLVNRPNKSKAFDGTRAVIEKIKADPKYTGYHIHVVEKTFNFATDGEVTQKMNGEEVKVPKGARMGLIYGTATNLAIMRNIERKSSTNAKADLIIKPGGADVYARSKYYVNRAINKFSSPIIEQWKSRADYPEELNRHVPLFHLSTTFKEMMNMQITRGKTNLGLGMFRASLYAEADGFNPVDEIAEEVRLNERMREKATRKWEGVEGGGVVRNRVLNALDDPRRTINAVYNGVPVIYEYGSWNNASIRSLDVAEIIKQPVPEKAQFTIKNVVNQINPTFKYYLKQLYKYSADATVKGNVKGSISSASKFARRSLAALGFAESDYVINIPTDETIMAKKMNPEQIMDQIAINIVNLENVKKRGSQYKAKQL